MAYGIDNISGNGTAYGAFGGSWGFSTAGNASALGTEMGGIAASGAVGSSAAAGGVGNIDGMEKSGAVRNPGADTAKQAGRVSSPAECETCQNRRYVDGSNEAVSFKAPTNISPAAAPAAVRAHEQEHVSNAYSKAAQNDGEVVQASVTIKMSICSECGKSYVAGGETMTKIRYSNEENPYQKFRKEQNADAFRGMNVDKAG